MTRVMTWTDRDGNDTVLDGTTGVLLRWETLGLEAPNPTNTIDRYVAFDGGALVNRRRDVRSLVLPLLIEHPTRVETKVAEVAAMLQGPGVLEWSDDVNTRYLKDVIYEAGIDGSGSGNLFARILVLSMIALDPWWYGPDVDAELLPAPGTAFDAAVDFDDFLPFDGGIEVPIALGGDGDAFPIITIVGPLTSLTVASGDQLWTLATPLANGDTIVIDANPGNRGPRLNGGPIDWSLLTEESRVWPLAPGTPTVTVGAIGDTVDSSVTLSAAPRFLTP